MLIKSIVRYIPTTNVDYSTWFNVIYDCNVCIHGWVTLTNLYAGGKYWNKKSISLNLHFFCVFYFSPTCFF